MTTDQTERDAAEEERLDSLHASGLLEPSDAEAFDRITRIARSVLKVDAAMVSLVDRDRQVFKSQLGLSGRLAEDNGSGLDRSFCKVAVASGQRFLVQDARTDPLVRESRLVSEDGLVAYAGTPLQVSTGHIYGTLCVVHESPREWSPDELEVLEDLAALTVSEIEYRLKTREIAGLEALAQLLPHPVGLLGDVVRSTASLADTPDDPRLPRMAEQARDRLGAVEAVAHDLEQAASNTRGRRASGPLTVDLRALLLRTCRLIGSAARPEDLAVRTDDHPAVVVWEGPNLGTGLSRILMAALQHLADGRQVEVTLDVKAESVEIRVISPGHLMPAGDLLRATSGFADRRTGEATKVSSSQRTTIVRSGPLMATTSPKGSEFVLTWPLRAASPSPEGRDARGMG